MLKNYVILYDTNNMVFPVKATFNPHAKIKEKAHHAGLPQFFGGTNSGNEGVLESLQREIWEESITTHYIDNGRLTLIHEDFLLDPNRKKRTAYDFFCTTDWGVTGAKWPSETNWALGPKDSREMCYVATVAKTVFKGLDDDTPTAKLAMMLIKAVVEQVPEWARDHIEIPGDEYLSSLTMAAFETFVRAWAKGNLP
jgi:hypothetical protein